MYKYIVGRMCMSIIAPLDYYSALSILAAKLLTPRILTTFIVPHIAL